MDDLSIFDHFSSPGEVQDKKYLFVPAVFYCALAQSFQTCNGTEKTKALNEITVIYRFANPLSHLLLFGLID